ncbi:hypothetical protein L2E82_29874 [Cichorium intybus]|uniref:Uncharacterized protein n=1 Tax=Cichorium intybus TaxID=13427 RepID=A0ACB9CYT4_CICIN|nr:hypothetical protein L2E82_29874 [Cichorium intybus]
MIPHIYTIGPLELLLNPIKLEEETNKLDIKQICKEWGVGMVLGSNVNRDQVEKLTREMIGGAKGKQMRSKAIEWKKTIEIATGPNGSSSLNVEKLANDINKFSKK